MKGKVLESLGLKEAQNFLETIDDAQSPLMKKFREWILHKPHKEEMGILYNILGAQKNKTLLVPFNEYLPLELKLIR